MDKLKEDGLFRRDGINYLLPFILITSCFALWGFAHNVTSPMVEAFSTIFRMNVTDGALVQVAFYGGYFCMAFPAALFIQRYTFKAGVLLGLTLFATGSLLFIPASMTGLYYPFLAAYFILTCGLSFLETSCNPYVYVMGSEQTATRRLNLAQAFNPIGNIAGMFVAMIFVQSQLNPMSTAERATLNDQQFEAVKASDLNVLIQPYIWLGIVVLIILAVLRLTRLPKHCEVSSGKRLSTALFEIFRIKNFREGVIAQFFYEGAEIICFTFIIQYGKKLFMGEGMSEMDARLTAQHFSIAAMLLFCGGRFFFTWLMRYVKAGRLLSVLAGIAIVCLCGVIMMQSRAGIVCLVLVSLCMSMMFPTIYGMALHGLKENVKFGGAGLVMSILGGSVFPPIQALIIDSGISVAGLPAMNVSFIVPICCFIVVAIYGQRALKRMEQTVPEKE